MQFNKFIYIAFIVFLVYFLLQILYFLVLVIIASSEGKRRKKDRQAEDYTRMRTSAFSLPVSIIIPAHNEEDWVLDSLKSALNQDYPEFEIVVIEDGSTDGTFSILDSFLKLRAIDKRFFHRFDSGKILEIYRSHTHANVSVVRKVGGFKKAGAVNAGLNFARYKYICVTDADTILEPDALLKVMSEVQKDPDNIIGTGSYFGLVNGFKIKDGKIIEKSFSRNPILAYQNLDYIRSLLVNRIAWSKFNAMPNVAGGFGIWRRDILLKLGGYNTDFSSEDIEFTFRAHDYIRENKKQDNKIIMLPFFVGWTEGPDNISSFIMQRNRWQRVVNETIWKYKHMIFSPRHGLFAFMTLPYYLLYEALGVFFEVASITLVTIGVIMRMLDFNTVLAFLIMMALSHAVISLLSLFIFIRNHKVFRPNDVVYFVILSFLEFLWYRWLMTLAKLLGTFSWLRGKRSYDQYVRRRIK